MGREKVGKTGLIEEITYKEPKSFQGHAREVLSINQTNHNYKQEETTKVLHKGAALPYSG